MDKARQVILFLLFASLWGASEVFVGGALYRAEIPRASVWLTGWALFILAMARGMLNIPGSSTATAALASVFRLMNAAPFLCHIGGILLTGIAFDIIATALMKHGFRTLRQTVTGVVSAYTGHAFFALVMTYVVEYEYWAGAGLAKVTDHIFVNGSLVALAAAVLVPIGYRIGRQGKNIVQRNPRWIFSFLFLFLIGLWTLGRIVQ